MRSASRRFMTKARVAVPLAAVAVALAGCGASAPSAAPPSGATPTATGTSPAAAPSTSAGVPTVSSVPTAPTTNAGAVCTTDDSGILTPAKMVGATKKGSWGQALQVPAGSFSGSMSVTAGVGKAQKPASNDFLAPSGGQYYLVIPISFKYVSGAPTSGLFDIQFTLRDPAGNVCNEDTLATILPPQKMLLSSSSGITVSATSPNATSDIIFDVPPGQDYSKYQLSFASDTLTNNAAVAWQN